MTQSRTANSSVSDLTRFVMTYTGQNQVIRNASRMLRQGRVLSQDQVDEIEWVRHG